jgi:hypothetical protein
MPRPASGANWNIADLRRILNERTRTLDRLQKRRQKAVRAVEAIDAEIAKIAGNGGLGRMGGMGGGRVRNDKSLPDYIEDFLSKNGKPARVGDIAEGVQSLGYRSNSKTFKNIVNQMLIKERKRFQAVDRGLYSLAKK